MLTSAYLRKQRFTNLPFLVLPEGGTNIPARVPAVALLPLGEFLQRQPIHDFWFLIHLRTFKDGKPNCYLSDPRRVRMGSMPFRFESEGELIYYLRHYELSSAAFLISHSEQRLLISHE